jgi:uncharacterized protein (DUF1800 family)
MRIFRASCFLLGCFVAAPLSAQETRLSNVAVRTSTGGGDTLITGVTIGPGPTKRVLIRAVGPTLTEFGVPGALTDPRLEVYNAEGARIAENDNWTTDNAAIFAAVGAFPLNSASKDAALVIDLPSGGYTVHVTGIGSSGQALVEVYEVSGGVTRLVNLSTRANVGTGANIIIPGISVAPGAGTRRLLVRAVGPSLGAFGVPGTLADPKLELFSGSNKIAENDNWGSPVGVVAADAATLAAAFANNGAFPLAAGSRDAALLINLAAGGYTLQVSGVGNTTGAALVEVYDLTPVNQTGAKPSASLYVARLRPDPTATGSLASGYATILINPDGTATVNVTFSNLGAAQTSAHLQLGASRDYVLNLPRGQVNGVPWTFAPSGAFTTNDLIEALNIGNIFVGLDSANYPGGELRGNFVRATGSQVFVPPAAPPPLPANALTAPTQTDAARFLTQATFGPTTADIAALQARGITGWIDDQIAMPMTSHHAALLADVAAFPNPTPPPGIAWKRTTTPNRAAAEWKIMITAPDQLRQRVALALSEILVVSTANDALGDNAEAVAKYHDILTAGAFGNYRQLLEDVTLSPAMGVFLSYVVNRKANPVTGTSPDENYAREIQQLFTIGLVQLQPDGTLMLDANGHPIPTYDQTTITETAKVFTGWTYAVLGAENNFGATAANPADLLAPDPTNAWLNPMRYFDAQHDKTVKRVVSLQQSALATATPTVIPANQTGPQDLKILLDTLFNHPNTGPFVCKQLIQRLVTSNPSPGYVYRVAQKFANDGVGVRGNLGAVIRTILTDYEARSPAVTTNIGYGKLKEPLIRTVGFFRLMKAAAPNGRFLDSWFGDPRAVFGPVGILQDPNAAIGQAALQAPSVFNYFSPDFSPPGPAAAAGLVAPEMQTHDAVYSLIVPNNMLTFLYRTAPPVANAPTPSPFLELNFAEFLPNARNSAALIDQLNLLFCGNSMSAATRARVTTAHQSAVKDTNPATTDTERVRVAMHLVLVSPDAAVQR